ncbi:hypothetical protein [Euzebya tangerina]|uniref:hypothetical protein n=1 Tax=Euzebya tangerina TaxID=591198 RepID=UPI000E31B7D7|nr:hypothetical protein [Euzebya tangerina]
MVVTLRRPVTDADHRRAESIADTLGHTTRREVGPAEIDVPQIASLAIAASGVLALLIVAGGLDLLAAESRRDHLVLRDVGSAPRAAVKDHRLARLAAHQSRRVGRHPNGCVADLGPGT